LLIVPILFIKTRPFFLFFFSLHFRKTLSTFLLFSYLNMSMNFYLTPQGLICGE